MLHRGGLSLLVIGVAAGSISWGWRVRRSGAVSNEAELRAAFATDTQIDVQADIVLTDCTGGGAVERTAAVTDPVTVDGHGHTIRQTCAGQRVPPGRLRPVHRAEPHHHRGPRVGQRRRSSPPARSRCRARRSPAIGPMPPAGVSPRRVLITADELDDATRTSAAESVGASRIGPDSPGATFTNSTVSNNVGGGIVTVPNAQQASVTAVNSTITGNTNGGSSLGSGIFSAGSTTLVYTTVADNVAGDFGNIETAKLESLGRSSPRAKGPATASPRRLHTGTTKRRRPVRVHGPDRPRERPRLRSSVRSPPTAALRRRSFPSRQARSSTRSRPARVRPTAPPASRATSAVSRPQGARCAFGAVEVEVPVSPVPPAPPAPPTPVTVTPRFTGSGAGFTPENSAATIRRSCTPAARGEASQTIGGPMIAGSSSRARHRVCSRGPCRLRWRRRRQMSTVTGVSARSAAITRESASTPAPDGP